MTRVLAIGVALGGAAALAVLSPAAIASPGAAGQVVSARVAPMLAVAVAPDGAVSTGSSTIAVSISRQRVGDVLIVTVVPTG